MYETCLCVAGSWRGTGGGSPGQQGVGGVREAGKERVGSGISTRAGSGKGVQEGKHSLFITAYIIQSKTQTWQRFLLPLILTFCKASNKILYVRKCKFVLGLKHRISFLKLETFLSNLRHWS